MRSSTLSGLGLLLSAASVNAAATANPSVPAPYMKGFSNPKTYYSTGGKAVCVEGMHVVQASTTKNIHFYVENPVNQSALTGLQVDLARINTATAEQITGNTNVAAHGPFNINSRICYPRGQSINTTTVQFLIHGVGLDKSYWDFAPGYSWIDAAAEAGYTTFDYDRLGIQPSSQPDGIQTVQAALQISIAHELVQNLRNGVFANSKFKHVVGAGHSFGSIQLQGLTNTYPEDLDAAVFTAYGYNNVTGGIFLDTLQYVIAAENVPSRFGSLPSSYVVADDASANQFAFYFYPNYDPKIFNKANVNKGTATLGELFSLISQVKPAPNYKGHIMILNGIYDLPICQGNCTYPDNQSMGVLNRLYPSSSTTKETYFLANTGHLINTHYSAGESFNVANAFYKKYGF